MSGRLEPPQNPREAPTGKSDPETAVNKPILDLLDGILELLEGMGRLAERAAQDDCSGWERRRLQQRLVRLRREIDRRVDSFESLYGTVPFNLRY